MPIYEYICPGCKQKFELLRPMSQSGEGVPCPNCGGQAQRVLSAFCSHSEESLDFMGSGGGPCSSCSSGSCSTCSL